MIIMSTFRGFHSISNLFRRNSQTIIQNKVLSSSTKDIVRTTFNNDFLLQNIKVASSTAEVFDLVSSHCKIMNSKHIIQALKNIFILQKSNTMASSTNKDVMNNKEFKQLCVQLQMQVRSLDLNETIEALKVLNFFGVPSNSKIYQSLLQIIRYNINDLSLQQIIFLDFILKQLKITTPLSEAITLTLPILMDINLPVKIDRENLSHLTDLLQFISNKNLSEKSINTATNAIMSHQYINPTEAISIVWSLCDLKCQGEDFEPLLQKSLDILSREGHDLKYCDLETTLSKLIFGMRRNRFLFYHENFFNMVANTTIEKNLGFQQALWILRKFTFVGHIHYNLLDYLIEQCKNDPNLLIKTNIRNFFIVLNGYTNCDYKNDNFGILKDYIQRNIDRLDLLFAHDYVKLCTELAVIDIYNEKILEKVFSNEYIKKLSENGSRENLECFMILYQFISTFQSQYSHILPSLEQIDSIKEQHREVDVDYPLKPALEIGCGGSHYVQTGLQTKLRHNLDHVVIMRKGGYPISFSSSTNETKYLEELQIPTESHIVIIFGCDYNYYSINCHHMKGTKILMLKTLEAMGYSVVPINLETWFQLTDYEKIPFLMREIRCKIEENEKISSIQ